MDVKMLIFISMIAQFFAAPAIASAAFDGKNDKPTPVFIAGAWTQIGLILLWVAYGIWSWVT